MLSAIGLDEAAVVDREVCMYEGFVSRPVAWKRRCHVGRMMAGRVLLSAERWPRTEY